MIARDEWFARKQFVKECMMKGCSKEQICRLFFEYNDKKIHLHETMVKKLMDSVNTDYANSIDPWPVRTDEAIQEADNGHRATLYMLYDMLADNPEPSLKLKILANITKTWTAIRDNKILISPRDKALFSLSGKLDPGTLKHLEEILESQKKAETSLDDVIASEGNLDAGSDDVIRLQYPDADIAPEEDHDNASGEDSEDDK